MSAADRRAARKARREARRLARQQRQDARGNRRLERQQNRQGFLTGIIGDGGLGGLVETAGDAFGGGGLPPTKDSTDTGDGKGMDTMTLALIGLGAYMLLNKKK